MAQQIQMNARYVGRDEDSGFELYMKDLGADRAYVEIRDPRTGNRYIVECDSQAVCAAARGESRAAS